MASSVSEVAGYRYVESKVSSLFTQYLAATEQTYQGMFVHLAVHQRGAKSPQPRPSINNGFCLKAACKWRGDKSCY